MRLSTITGRLALLAAVSLAASASAAVTNDRVYRLGEDSLELATAGAVVGSGHSIPGSSTLDSQGPTFAFLDLQQIGSPVYANVAAGPKARPGGGLAVQFDGTDDVLFGARLNRPDELATVVGGSYPLNYTGITVRGMQAWVYPDQAGLAANKYQSIVFDSIFSGGPAINAAGRWTQTNSNHDDGVTAPPVPGVGPAVTGNTWYHVMHHNYASTDPVGSRIVAGAGRPFTSVLYVDGMAVSANNDNNPTGGAAAFVDQLVVGGAEKPGDGATPVYGNFFTGVVDELEMYVYGDNTAQGGQNWGTFDLFADNDWIANKIATTVPGGVLTPGDVNRDGAVNGTGAGPAASDDVTAFVAGWRRTKTFQGAHNTLSAGDWETWGWGDMNHDGTVNLSDWRILRANHPTPASLNLGALFGAVPEPHSVMLAGLALLGTGVARRNRRLR